MPELSLRFLVLDGRFKGQVHSLFPGMVLGRGEQVHLYLPDFKASRRHARVRLEDSVYELEDLESHNGTFVNGDRVERRALGVGDIVHIGSTRLEVRSEEASTERNFAEELAPGVVPTLVRRLDKLTPPTLEEFSADAYLATLGLPAVDEEVGTDRLRRLVTKTRNFAIVYQITKALSTAAQVDELLRKALDFILTVISASRGYMILRDPETGELVSAASTAQANEEEHTLKVSQTIIEWVIKERSAVISSDATTDQRFEDKKSIVLYDIRSVLCAPMMYGSRVVGVIQLDSVGVGSGFTEDDLDLITVIAPVLGVAIENTRLIEAQEKTIAELREAHNKLVSAQERLVAKERMALVGRITSGLAHEIRNLMSPFMLVDLLQEEYPEDENIGEYASLMIEAYGRIGSLVEEIRLLARGEQSQLQLASHSINETLESVVRFVRCDQEVRIHPITIDCEPVSPFVFDENRIKQVLINLIRNAVQSMDSKGAVSLKAGISADKPRFLRLVVTDEGEGIDTENLQRIWEPFFSTKERDGTGLGLHLCRGIVEQHGGSMACDSTPGVGTSMIVFLPIDLDPSGG